MQRFKEISPSAISLAAVLRFAALALIALGLGAACELVDPLPAPPGVPCSVAADCPETDHDCFVAVCARGVCLPQAQTGRSCDAGDPCTVGLCNSDGDCVGTDKVCEDGDPCTVGRCDAEGECRFDPIPDCGGIVCVDHDDCDDGDPCTVNVCNDNRCFLSFAEGAECDDGDPCTVNNVCDERGECVGTPKDCPDGGSCTFGFCDEEGNCQVDDVPDCRRCVDDNDCDDENPCTTNTCDEGECRDDVQADVACDDGDPCTNGVCDDEGTCVGTAISNDCGLRQCGASPSGCYECGDCDAGFGCNDEGMCDSLCEGVQCPQCQACRAGFCVPSSEGAACEGDGDVCTVSTCQAGQCVSDPKPNDCGTRECGQSPSGCYSCGACSPGWACNANGQCFDPCVGISCPECQTCQGGTCVSADEGDACTGDGDDCRPGTCRSGACVETLIPNDCGTRECGPSPSGCHDCGPCAPGWACNANGQCFDPCVGIQCDECQTCQGGTCVSAHEGAACTGNNDACRPGTCRSGSCVQTLIDSDCGARECGPSPSGCHDCGTCPEGKHCNAGGQCVYTVTEAATVFVDCSAGSCVVLLDCAGGECALDNWDGTYDRLDESVAAVVLDSDGFIMICWEAPGRVARWISVSVRAEVRAPRNNLIGSPCGTYRIQAQSSEAGSPQTLVDASPPSTSWREVGPFSYTSPQGNVLCALIEEGRGSNQSCTSDAAGARDALARSITMQVSADIFAGGS
jgi:hypothetical protein